VLEIVRETEGMSTVDAFRLLHDGALPTYRAMQHSEDALEGPRAFAEKRSPQWKGH
jgi:crotonobetainyl-CoA hydratase